MVCITTVYLTTADIVNKIVFNKVYKSEADSEKDKKISGRNEKHGNGKHYARLNSTRKRGEGTI